MLQTMRILFLVCITAVLAGCPGGDGDSTPNFAGTYQLSTGVVSSNTCGGVVDNLPSARAIVTQDGRTIKWTEEDGSYPGTLDADNGGFTVNANESGVNVVLSLRSGGGNNFAVKMTVTAGCTIVWTGTATKS